MLCSIAHLYRESRVADSLIDDVTREHGYPQFLSGCSGSSCLAGAGFKEIRRYRFYNRRPFNPARVPRASLLRSIALAQELYEREGALVVTARR